MYFDLPLLTKSLMWKFLLARSYCICVLSRSFCTFHILVCAHVCLHLLLFMCVCMLCFMGVLAIMLLCWNALEGWNTITVQYVYLNTQKYFVYMLPVCAYLFVFPMASTYCPQFLCIAHYTLTVKQTAVVLGFQTIACKIHCNHYRSFLHLQYVMFGSVCLLVGLHSKICVFITVLPKMDSLTIRFWER